MALKVLHSLTSAASDDILVVNYWLFSNWNSSKQSDEGDHRSVSLFASHAYIFSSFPFSLANTEADSVCNQSQKKWQSNHYGCDARRKSLNEEQP